MHEYQSRNHEHAQSTNELGEYNKIMLSNDIHAEDELEVGDMLSD